MTALQQIKERPILFSGPMVRAILEGRKTQTRRIAKPFNLPEFDADSVHKIGPGEFIGWHGDIIPDPYFTIRHYPLGTGIKCKYGNPGERLWVRETWCWPEDYTGPIYRADGDELPSLEQWRPSLFMPRAACRILLEITNIRVERLQDISEQDAIAEGIERFRPVPGDGPAETYFKIYQPKGDSMRRPMTLSAKRSFQSLWQSINGPESWEQNPWVWVIEFKKL